MVIDANATGRPDINNHGEIVWARNPGGGNSTIMSSVRGAIATGGFYDPIINDLGEIVWRISGGGLETNERGELFTPTNGHDPYPDAYSINNLGEIVVGRKAGTELWSSTRGNLSKSGIYARHTRVNDSGEIVYVSTHSSTLRPRIYSSTRGAIQDDSSVYPFAPDINSHGEIVWAQQGEIWSNIRGKLGDGSYPAINDAGEVVWSHDGNLFSSARGQLTDDGAGALYPRVNNAGAIVFRSGSSVLLMPEPTPDLKLDTSAAAAAGLSDERALPTAMPFDDGVSNLTKYAFNMNLAAGDSRAMTFGGRSGLPSFRIRRDQDGTFFELQFVRRKGSGLRYLPK